MTATTRRSFRVVQVITTRMIETVNRLVIVTHMAHGHHWAIRPRQLDVCSRANKHAARCNFVPYIRSGVHMPRTRNRDVSDSYEAAAWPKTVASQPASNRRRPLEVAIFIVEGTDKYQWTDRALANLLMCRSCRCAGGMWLVWAPCVPHGLGTQKGGVVPRGRQNPAKFTELLCDASGVSVQYCVCRRGFPGGLGQQRVGWAELLNFFRMVPIVKIAQKPES